MLPSVPACHRLDFGADKQGYCRPSTSVASLTSVTHRIVSTGLNLVLNGLLAGITLDIDGMYVTPHFRIANSTSAGYFHETFLISVALLSFGTVERHYCLLHRTSTNSTESGASPQGYGK